VTGQNFGFSQQFRLKKATEFSNVFSNPVKSTDRYFTILAIPTSFGHPRIGLAITKKIIRTAVRRNVIKRTVRESFRLQRQVMGSMDFVVLVRKDAVDASVGALRVSLTKHWLRLLSRCA
jgi:ribonuclease P protein component